MELVASFDKKSKFRLILKTKSFSNANHIRYGNDVWIHHMETSRILEYDYLKSNIFGKGGNQSCSL